ncbi:HAD-IB family phosphatase [Candidatus Saccharibacteria bacterium]|nr:HAD-IB family phosphatase [Candidatus Saccharibacteria bacterium]MCB9817114.1 HAD-IB family phosphatase [Candidatus Nomurabacteria bacterium]HPD99098.1 HAD-IB family phosphatase [Candidatus Saccharibacteria bacterium]
MEPKLIAFDLNKTLIRENSWLNLNIAMGVSTAEDDILVRWSQQRIITDAMGQQILCEIYKQRGDISYQAIWKILSNYTYVPHAKKVVALLQSRGYSVALVSGAMDILVKAVAEELDIKHWRAANTFIFNEFDMLQRIDSVKNDAHYKAEMLLELCNELQCTPKECLVVGDGANDIELFKLTGNGVTFTGSNIKHEARYIITGLDEILDIVV